MPASIALAQISWVLPDSTPLLKDLNLTFSANKTGLIGRNGTGKTTLLNLICGALKPASGSVTVNGTVGVLRQQLQHSNSECIADLFGVSEDLGILRKAEMGLASVEELGAADWTLESRMVVALEQMGLSHAVDTPLTSLSGGQITRCRLAALLFQNTDFLLLDEPTNNLDKDGREALRAFLNGWNKGAIIVSHDRDLLEQVDSIVELTSLGATTYGGAYSFYRERKALELASVEQDLASAEKRVSEICRKIQNVAERKARKDGAGHRSRAKRDQPKILLNARRNKAENSGGSNAILANRLRGEAQQQMVEAREKLEILQPISMNIASSAIARGLVVLSAEKLSIGYAGCASLLRNLSLTIAGPERVVLQGPNGSGKSTLLKTLLGELAPIGGSCRVHPSVRMLDQQANMLTAEKTVLENFRYLNPAMDENASRAVLARFLFRGKASEQTVVTLSGGMMLRAGLACVLGGLQPPKLLILDEPSNHLDMDAVEAMEAGLNAYDGALLIISHDEAFLRNIGITRSVDLREYQPLPADI